MDNRDYNQILEKIDKLNNQLNDKQGKTLDLDLVKRIVIRLKSFDCTQCENDLYKLSEYINYIYENQNSLERQKLKEYNKFIEQIKTHLQKKHGLFTEGYYLSIYMSLGISVGLMLGLAFFEHWALGMCFGMSTGIAIGSGIDADHKKKGKII